MVFFGGLWWTIRTAVPSRQPALWFAVSALVRTALALAGLYFISAGNWKRLVAGLVGFVAARIVVARVLQSADTPAPGAVREANHAP